jgi:hypothetical protein
MKRKEENRGEGNMIFLGIFLLISCSHNGKKKPFNWVVLNCFVFSSMFELLLLLLLWKLGY